MANKKAKNEFHYVMSKKGMIINDDLNYRILMSDIPDQCRALTR